MTLLDILSEEHKEQLFATDEWKLAERAKKEIPDTVASKGEVVAALQQMAFNKFALTL